MKKFLIFIFVLAIMIINIDTKAFIAKKIDLKIKDDETNIVFLKLRGSVSLLIKNEDNSNLFILEYKNDKGLKEAIKIFDDDCNIFYLNKDIDKQIDNIHVLKSKNVLNFRINNYTLCVYDGYMVNSCDFIYLPQLNKSFVINENLSAIFYDEDVDIKYLNDMRESWIEKAIVRKDSFTILKLYEDSYDILIVPSTNT